MTDDDLLRRTAHKLADAGLGSIAVGVAVTEGKAVVRVWTVPGERWVDYDPSAAEAFSVAMGRFAREARQKQRTMDSVAKLKPPVAS